MSVLPFPIEPSALRAEGVDPDIADVTVDVEHAALASIEAARVRRYVRALPPMERKVIELHYGFDGPPLPLRHVAKRLNLSLKRIWQTEQDALTLLRQSYHDQEAA